MIKAIETRYKGYRFRSRLEARWAVFFDALGLAWEYEPEGFELPDGERYLPDFFLPKFCGGLWVEVKPAGGDRSKASVFAGSVSRPVLMAEGTPDFRAYEVYYPDSENHALGVAMFAGKYISGTNKDECRLFWEPGIENADLSIDVNYFDDDIADAIYAARGARFEHGESGHRYA